MDMVGNESTGTVGMIDNGFTGTERIVRNCSTVVVGMVGNFSQGPCV